MRKLLSFAVFILFFATSAFADEIEELKKQMQAMQEQFQEKLNEMQKQHNEMVNNLQARIEQLESQREDRQAQLGSREELKKEIPSDLKSQTLISSQPPLFSQTVGTSQVKLMDISFDSLFTAGASTASETEINRLEAGSHDPKKRGFTTQNLELSLLGAVDPYLNGESHLIFQVDRVGDSKIEVEEAFLTTQSLPYGLQLKAGTFFTEFGRLNPQHPHSWDFVDQPIISSRMFGGDGLRTPGGRLSWLSPLPWYSEVLLGVQNANGETAFSFLNKEGENFSGYTLIHREVHSAEDLLCLTRWLNSLNLSDEVTLNLGTSALFGPNASGVDNRTNIYGADIYLKWKPLLNDRGFPFLASQTEFMKRKYEAGETKDNLDDYGLYTQLLWGFKKNWVAGLRYDFSDGNGLSTDSLRDRRHRISPNLTWYPTEFSKIRLQYNYDRAGHISDDKHGDEHSIWLQYEFMLGSHPKHKF